MYEVRTQILVKKEGLYCAAGDYHVDSFELQPVAETIYKLLDIKKMLRNFYFDCDPFCKKVAFNKIAFKKDLMLVEDGREYELMSDIYTYDELKQSLRHITEWK